MNLKTVAAQAEATTGEADPVTVVLAAEATAVEAAAAGAGAATEIVAVVEAVATAIVVAAVEAAVATAIAEAAVVATDSAVLDVMTSDADRHAAPATDGLLNMIARLDSTRATQSLKLRRCPRLQWGRPLDKLRWRRCCQRRSRMTTSTSILIASASAATWLPSNGRSRWSWPSVSSVARTRLMRCWKSR